MKSESGFTLIEILVTTAIIGIIGAIAVMASQGLIDSFKVRGAAREVYSDLQMVRLRAIKEGRRYAVCFSPGDTAFTSYSIRNTPGLDGILCTGDDDLAGPAPFFIKNVSFVSGDYSLLSFDENFITGTSLEFSANGTASNGTITVRKGIKTLILTVNQSTGNITMQ